MNKPVFLVPILAVLLLMTTVVADNPIETLYLQIIQKLDEIKLAIEGIEVSPVVNVEPNITVVPPEVVIEPNITVSPPEVNVEVTPNITLPEKSVIIIPSAIE